MRTAVLLMTSDRLVTAAVSKAMESNGHILLAVPRDQQELVSQLSANPAVIAVVDLDPHPQQILTYVEQIAGRFPATRFVALAGALPPELLQDAMQAGVRRVVVKQSIESELEGVLNRLSPGDLSAGEPSGEVITILQASGGCGATTIAANLAAELASANPAGPTQPTLLIDLDCCYGALTTYFGLSPLYAVDHLLHYERVLDVELVRSTATARDPQLHLLASPASTQGYRVQHPDFSRLGSLIEVASRAYRHTVIDAPRLPADVVATLVSASTHVLLVFQLSVKDVRLGRAMLDALDELAVPRSHLIPLANRYVRRSSISLDDAAKVLGGGIAVRHLQNDYSTAIEAINFGKTLAQVSPRSPFRRDLQQLLTDLAPARKAGWVR